MKAKEIVKKFVGKVKDNLSNEGLINECIDEIVIQFWNDFAHLRSARNIKFDKGLLPLFRELDNKWNTVRRLLFKRYGQHLIKPEGFGIILKMRFPKGYEYYKNNKE